MAMEVILRLFLLGTVMCSKVTLEQEIGHACLNMGTTAGCRFYSAPCPHGTRAWLLEQGSNFACISAVGHRDDFKSPCPSTGDVCTWDHGGADVQGVLFRERCWLNASCAYDESQEKGSCKAGEELTFRYQCIPDSQTTEFTTAATIQGTRIAVVFTPKDNQTRKDRTWYCQVHTPDCSSSPFRVVSALSPNSSSCTQDAFTTIGVTGTSDKGDIVDCSKISTISKTLEKNSTFLVYLQVRQSTLDLTAVSVLSSVDGKTLRVTCGLMELPANCTVSGQTAADVGGAVAGVFLFALLVALVIVLRRKITVCPRLVPKPGSRILATSHRSSKDLIGSSQRPDLSTHRHLDNGYEVVNLFPDRGEEDLSKPAIANRPPAGYELAKPIREDTPKVPDLAKADYDVVGEKKTIKDGASSGAYGHLNMTAQAAEDSCYDHVTRGGRTRVINTVIYHRAMLKMTSAGVEAYDQCLLEPQAGKIEVLNSPYDAIAVPRK